MKKIKTLFVAVIALGLMLSERAEAIVGGTSVNPGEHPYMAAVIHETITNVPWGGGVLVHPKWVLTANHLIASNDQWSIGVGGVSGSLQDFQETVRVIRIVKHPNPDTRSGKADFALLELERPVTLSNRVQTIPLNRDLGFGFSGQGVALGFGERCLDCGRPDVLNKVTLPLLGRFEEMAIVASNHRSGKSLCAGDSGGPVVKGGKLIGILGNVAWPFCEGTVMLNDVSQYSSWIESVIFGQGASAGNANGLANVGLADGGIYEIKNRHSQAYLAEEILSGDQNGNIVQRRDITTGFQQWRAESAGSGRWYFQNVGSGAYLSVQGNSGENQANLTPSRNRTFYQRWFVKRNAQNRLILLNEGTGKVIETIKGSFADGANAFQNLWTNANEQQWSIVRASSALPVSMDQLSDVSLEYTSNEVRAVYRFSSQIPLASAFTLYMDTDRRASTGYDQSPNLGADFILLGNHLYRYDGTDARWDWDFVVKTNVSVSGNTMTLSWPRGITGISLNARFVGDRSATAGQGFLVKPNNTGVLVPSAASGGNQGAVADTTEARWTVANTTTYHHTITDPNGNFQPSSNTFTFLDTDGNTGTGFATYGIGSDFMVRNSSLYRYSGTGGGWGWVLVSNTLSTTSVTNGVRFSIPKNLINGVGSFRWIFYANNGPFNQPSVSYPNSGPVWFVGQETPPAPIFDGNLSDWNRYQAFEKDPDDVFGTANRIDFRQAFLTNQGGQFYMGIHNDLAIIPGNGWMIFLDVNATNGYRLYGRNADYLIRDRTLYRYNGSGSNWAWTAITNVDRQISGSTMEMRFSQSLLNLQQGQEVNFKLFGDNEFYSGGTGVDNYPDNGAWLRYLTQ